MEPAPSLDLGDRHSLSWRWGIQHFHIAYIEGWIKYLPCKINLLEATVFVNQQYILIKLNWIAEFMNSIKICTFYLLSDIFMWQTYAIVLWLVTVVIKLMISALSEIALLNGTCWESLMQYWRATPASQNPGYCLPQLCVLTQGRVIWALDFLKSVLSCLNFLSSQAKVSISLPLLKNNSEAHFAQLLRAFALGTTKIFIFPRYTAF